MAAISRFELEKMSIFQEEIHNPRDAQEKIESIFYREFRKSLYHTTQAIKLKCSPDGTKLVFTANNAFHFLMYTYMCQHYPAIRVKPEYRGKYKICWPHNLATAPYNLAEFKVDDEVFGSFDNFWCDMYFQHYMKPGFRDHHNIDVGNIDCLEKWTDYLPSYTTNVDHPWSYSFSPALAFPLFYGTSQTRVEHHYSLKRKVGDLLRMKKIEGSTSKELVKVDFRVLDGVTELTKLRLPELWGQYGYVKDQEINYYKNCLFEESNRRIFYIKDVVRLDSDNPTTYGNTANIKLHCDSPDLAMFWNAENIRASAVRNFSNYSTNTADLYTGWDPIRFTSLLYGNKVRIDKMESHHFSAAQPRHHFPSAPSEVGYHAQSFADDSTNFDAEVGPVFSLMDAQLNVGIDDGNIFIERRTAELIEEEEEGDGGGTEAFDIGSRDLSTASLAPNTNPEFIVRVRLFVLNRFVVEKDKKDPNLFHFNLVLPLVGAY